MHTYRAVIWDFDGVIYNSHQATWRTACTLFAHHNLPVWSYEQWRHRAANSFEWLQALGIPWSITEIKSFWGTHYDHSGCDLVDGAHEVLTHLRGESLPCAIVSAYGTARIIARLEHFAIRHHFSRVAGSTMYKQKEIEQTCDALGVAREEALYVGDLHSDVLDGKAAGVSTVLLAPHDYPHIKHAHHHITELVQLKKLFE